MSFSTNKSMVFRMAAVIMAMIVATIIFSFSPVSISATAAELDAEDYAVMSSGKMNAVTITPLAADGAVDDGGGAGDTTGDDAYSSVIGFFIKWFKRIGMMVAFVGAIMFGLAIKNNDAEQKQNGLLTLIAGFVVAAICFASDMFNLFD